jgi:hypothetical protein
MSRRVTVSPDPRLLVCPLFLMHRARRTTEPSWHGGRLHQTHTFSDHVHEAGVTALRTGLDARCRAVIRSSRRHRPLPLRRRRSQRLLTTGWFPARRDGPSSQTSSTSSRWNASGPSPRRCGRAQDTAPCGDSTGSAFGQGRGTGHGRARCGHQNQRPSRAASDGVMSDRTTSVSKSSPRPMVVPT